jgi:hypothetical protein
LQLPVNLSRLELRKEIIELNSQVLPGLLDGLNLSTPNILVQAMQKLQSLIMLGVREILNIGLRVVHDGGEPLKHRINVLTGKLSKVLILDPLRNKEASLHMVITTVSNQQLLPNLPAKIQMANTLKLRITQASDQVIDGFCICLILGLSTGIGHHKSVDIRRNSIGLVKHNEILQLTTKKDHHSGRPLVVTLPIEVRRTAPVNVRHLRIQDLSKSPRI